MVVETASVRRESDGKVWTLPRTARHNKVLWLIYEETGKRVGFSEYTQGFNTDCGRFLTRKQALVVVRKSGQLKDGKIIGGVLTSEDLW